MNKGFQIENTIAGLSSPPNPIIAEAFMEVISKFQISKSTTFNLNFS